MNDSKIPVRYSKALFESALEKDKLDKVYDDMKIVRGLCSMKEVRDILDNPVISPVKRREIFGAVTGKDIDGLTVKFLDLVFARGREKYLHSMALDFINETRKHRGIKEVTITTVVPVTDAIRKEITSLGERTMKSDIELIEKTDASLIGGFILQVDDTYVDASVRSRLNRFKKEFASAKSK